MNLSWNNASILIIATATDDGIQSKPYKTIQLLIWVLEERDGAADSIQDLNGHHCSDH